MPVATRDNGASRDGPFRSELLNGVRQELDHDASPGETGRGRFLVLKTCLDSVQSRERVVTEIDEVEQAAQGMEGKFNSEAYQAFLLSVLAQTHEPLFLLQDGAKYHTSKATKAFFAQHAARLTVFQLPSYSPDYNPIEYLWRKTKRLATHNKYFAEFVQLIESVEQALTKFAQQPEDVLNLFGFYCDESGMPREFAA